MEIIFGGHCDKHGRLVSADVLQIGKPKPIESVYDGKRDWLVTEDFPKTLPMLPVRLAVCTVVSTDGK